jgi:hypothetical protein
MAIDKIEGGKKFEFSAPILIQLGAALILTLAALLVGWFSFANWRFKSSLIAGYQAHDSGNLGAARTELKAALDWKPDHVPARELLAKIHADGGDVDAAQREYQEVRKRGGGSPCVGVGLGVCLLRKADRAAAEKEIRELVAKARVEFQGAASAIEGQIGLGHCELLLASKLNDRKSLDAAKAIFTKVKTSLDASKAPISREGLVDYYAGFGKALGSSSTSYDRDAAAAWVACSQLLPRWHLPKANVLALETRRLAGSADGSELMKAEADAVALRKSTEALRNNKDVGPSMRGPWLAYATAMAAAYGRAGQAQKMDLLLGEFRDLPGYDAFEPQLAAARLRGDLAAFEHPNPADQEKQVMPALQAYVTLVNKLGTPTDEAGKALKATVLNNQAWMKAWQAGWRNQAPTTSQPDLDQALKLASEDYVINRNMAVVLKRLKRPADQIKPFLEKAQAAAKGAEAEDFDKVKQYVEGN